jgi:hypothetical protein
MLKFIGYRVFEIIGCLIIGTVASVFIVPFAGLVLKIIIPDFVLTDEIESRLILLISGSYLIYWWYLAFTDRNVEAMGFKKNKKTHD